MASVTGYVQFVEVFQSSTLVKVGIGPTPSDVQLLGVIMESSDTTRQVAIKAALIDALSTALAARREVTVVYNSGSEVTHVEMTRA
jgi:hypothetical protein